MRLRAIILAAAGLKRLGLASRIRAVLAPEDSLPAAGQGAMAIEIRSGRADGADLVRLLAPLNHTATAQAVTAERKVSKIFGGSCQIPLAAFATVEGEQMRLRAMVATPDGARMASADVSGSAGAPECWASKWPNCCAGKTPPVSSPRAHHTRQS